MTDGSPGKTGTGIPVPASASECKERYSLNQRPASPAPPLRSSTLRFRGAGAPPPWPEPPLGRGPARRGWTGMSGPSSVAGPTSSDDTPPQVMIGEYERYGEPMTQPVRPSGRAFDVLRAVSLEPGFSKHAEGSCLARFG